MVSLSSRKHESTAMDFERTQIGPAMSLDSIRATVAIGDSDLGDGMCMAVRQVLVKSGREGMLEDITLEEWTPILEEAESLLEDWKDEAREGAPEDSPCIDWQGFNCPSEC